MTSEREAFLTAILASPDDDTPRLVFADWLDENGNEEDRAHAALIRAQCQAETFPKGSRERRKREREANAILERYGDLWAKPLRDLNLVNEWTFRRGFLDGVQMSATSFANHAKKVFDVAPTIRTAHFPDASNEVRRLANCAFLARLAVVDLSRMCSCGRCPIHNDLRALFSSKHTAALSSLNVAGDRMDVVGAKRLARSSALARLTRLDLSTNPLGELGIAELGRSKKLQRLQSLRLSKTFHGNAGLVALAEWKNVPALRHLDLSINFIDSQKLTVFLAAPLFAQLTSLNLSQNKLGDPGAELLAALPKHAKLEYLDVRSADITEHGVMLLKKRFGKGLKV